LIRSLSECVKTQNLSAEAEGTAAAADLSAGLKGPIHFRKGIVRGERKGEDGNEPMRKVRRGLRRWRERNGEE